MAVKILLVDDHPVLRLTLRKWLERARDLKVVGEAEPGSPVLALIGVAAPDVVLVDVHASPEEGLNMARLIHEHYPELPMVAIGDARNGKLRAASARAGAWAYFPNQRPDEMARAIRSVIGRTGKQFVDLSKQVSQRPSPESFVGLPGDRPRPAPPQPREPKPSKPKPKPSRPAAESFVGLPDGESRPAELQPAAQAAAPKPAPPKPAAPRPAAPKPAAAKPAAAKLPKPKPSRPAAESFVGLPDEEALQTDPERKSPPREDSTRVHAEPTPERMPARKNGVARPASPAKTPALSGARTDAPAEFAAAAPAPAAQRFDLGHTESPSRKAPRTRRKKNEVLDEAIEVRGPTGLPRRFGGHR